MSILFFGGALLVGALFSILSLVFYIFVIVDCAKYESDQGNTKIIWILVILFAAPPLGGIIYYLVRRPERISMLGR